jgi:biopolymer transport protein ExbD
MAELNASNKHAESKNAGVKTLKKNSTRVDLTPMVDLGFLLITFFIFTTTMSQPTSMKLIVPKDADDLNNRTAVKESGTLTLLPSDKDRIYYYRGNINNTGSNLFYTTKSKIRDVIINKKRRTNPEDFYVIIKPTNSSNYKSLVDVLDEMIINNVNRYALVNISQTEEQLIAASNSRK